MRTFLALLLLAAPVAALRAQPQAAAGATAAAQDSWLPVLSALLASRYQTTGDLRISWIRPRPASAPADADLEILAAPPELAPQILVQVRAHDAAGRASEHVLVLRAELWREGWTLRQPAAHGAALDLAMLDSRSLDVLRERDAFTVSAAELPELDFARAVPAGRTLLWRDLARRPLVRRGQTVDVVASDGPLVVSLRAVALHDAARGDAVRVRNPESRKEFTALVIAESRAAVRF